LLMPCGLQSTIHSKGYSCQCTLLSVMPGNCEANQSAYSATVHKDCNNRKEHHHSPTYIAGCSLL